MYHHVTILTNVIFNSLIDLDTSYKCENMEHNVPMLNNKMHIVDILLGDGVLEEDMNP